MEYIKVDNVEQAIDALNKHHGLPKEGCYTFFDESSFLEYEGEMYIAYDEDYTAILGEPVVLKFKTNIE